MLTPPSAEPVIPSRLYLRWFWISLFLLLIGAGSWGGYVLAIRSLQQACLSAQTAKRWTDLEVAARRWSRLAPDAAEPWAYLANAVQHQERFVEAAEYLGQVPAKSPQYLTSQLARSKILFGPANRPFDGEQICREILDLEPRVEEAQQLLIQFYTVTLQRTKLREQIQSAIYVGRESPDCYIYYFLIDSVRLGDGVPLNALWLASYPDNEILKVAELMHGEDTLNEEYEAPSVETSVSLTEKESKARSLLERFPHNANLLAYLADQELSKGRADKVIELLSQTLIETESDPRFWRFKGWVHFTRKEYGDAEQSYRKGLEIHPLDWLTMHRLAEILRIKGETVEVTRLERLVQRAHDLRVRIRELKSVVDPPLPLLREIGILAQDAGDSLIADALAKRLGPLGRLIDSTKPQSNGP